jgi:SAM-dependent methyltransferase
MENVREHFRKTASSFDRLYEEDRPLQRFIRPGIYARRRFAQSVVESQGSPTVLDVGCGSARVGEDVLSLGSTDYLGIDFSEPMLELARKRLARFGPRARLLQADFLEVDLEEKFDLVLLLGVFDYTPEPHEMVVRARDACKGSVVASFPRWNWVKGPVRKLRYEVLNDCPIFDYTEREIRFLFGAAGFARTEVFLRGRSGHLVRADL